jgi:hypothetical protein
MKSLFALAAVIAFAAAPAFAGEGHVSHKSLSNMGLSGMKSMTDAQGMGVRGLSIAVVTGDSNVNLGHGNSADSQFFAAGGPGKGTHSAAGFSASSASVDFDAHHHSFSLTITTATAAGAIAH